MPDFIYNKCPVCGNAKYSSIGHCDLGTLHIDKPEKSEIVECAHCDTIYVNPLPVWTPEDFSVLYSKVETYFTQSEKWQYKRENEVVEYRFRAIDKHIQTKNKNLLEVGAGIQAYMAKYLNQRQWNVAVQEPSPEFIEQLKKSYPAFEFINANLADIHSPEKYSLIYIDSVMEHVPNPVDYARKCADLLEDGGILYFISPNEHSLSNRIKTWRNKLKGRPVSYLCPYTNVYHLIGFSKKGVKILAGKSGFKVLQYMRRKDYTWFHTLENKPFLIKYPLAFASYLIDLIGWGNNQEIMLIKESHH